jgi:5-methylthioadenosine/S-adenosylhomocysteine deaminase
MQAYADCGIRATVALDQPNVPELDKLPFLARCCRRS